LGAASSRGPLDEETVEKLTPRLSLSPKESYSGPELREEKVQKEKSAQYAGKKWGN